MKFAELKLYLFKTLTIEDLLNVFTEFSEIRDKNICHYSKRARTYHLLCKRGICETQDL